ncbi:hypothetical protein [Streptomyces monashensis]|uniref:Uncharacterized protein n=1 Tax=Streptomyces monashensis TaxID=1678012 RepID=A0A1S2QP11_9ACTN|nr:hypothetical protein [Streptomyces monashensis]OIK07889.1 hypothetical protein BIV23_02745 [Streptomyces monashensis]
MTEPGPEAAPVPERMPEREPVRVDASQHGGGTGLPFPVTRDCLQDPVDRIPSTQPGAGAGIRDR